MSIATNLERVNALTNLLEKIHKDHISHLGKKLEIQKLERRIIHSDR